MKPNTVAHNLGRDHERFKTLNNGEYCDDQQRMQPITKLHESNNQRSDKDDDSAQKWNDCKNNCGNAYQQGVIQANQQKAKSVENPISDRNQNLSSKKCNQIAVNRVENKN